MSPVDPDSIWRAISLSLLPKEVDLFFLLTRVRAVHRWVIATMKNYAATCQTWLLPVLQVIPPRLLTKVKAILSRPVGWTQLIITLCPIPTLYPSQVPFQDLGHTLVVLFQTAMSTRVSREGPKTSLLQNTPSPRQPLVALRQPRPSQL